MVPLDGPPAVRIAAAVGLIGESHVAERAAALLDGEHQGDEFLRWVGGRQANGILGGDWPAYWPQVWGARALLYAWDDSAGPAVARGLDHEAWRVREMCGKVIAARELPYPDAIVPLLSDEVARVRVVAARALGSIGEYEHVVQLRSLDADRDIAVRRAVDRALVAGALRLDREILD
jgi:HEAT repeat protein